MLFEARGNAKSWQAATTVSVNQMSKVGWITTYREDKIDDIHTSEDGISHPPLPVRIARTHKCYRDKMVR